METQPVRDDSASKLNSEHEFDATLQSYNGRPQAAGDARWYVDVRLTDSTNPGTDLENP